MNYQEAVTTRGDIRALYEKVKADPTIQKYRGVGNDRSYAWDEVIDDYTGYIGEVWFDNPSYDPDHNRDAVVVAATEAVDSVSHPSHYTYGKIECIDFILDKQLDFSLGNAVKYIVRAGHKSETGKTDKEKAIEDLKKAIQYIQFEIEHLEGKR